LAKAQLKDTRRYCAGQATKADGADLCAQHRPLARSIRPAGAAVPRETARFVRAKLAALITI
jgi:hypothetical protein